MAEDQFPPPSLLFKVLGSQHFATFGQKVVTAGGFLARAGSGAKGVATSRFSKKATLDLDKTGSACRGSQTQKTPFWKNSTRVAGPKKGFLAGFLTKNSRM